MLLLPGDYSVVVETDEKFLSHVQTSISGGELSIGPDSVDCIITPSVLNYHISMPDIQEINIEGSGRINGQTPIEVDDLKIKIDGSGDISLELNVDNLESSIDGSGDITLKGDAQKHSIGISGSGSVNAFDLITKETKVRVSGSGDSDVYAIDKLDIDISGSGDVRYKGMAQVIQSVSGSGKVKAVE